MNYVGGAFGKMRVLEEERARIMTFCVSEPCDCGGWSTVFERARIFFLSRLAETKLLYRALSVLIESL